ncbi:MAG TPA: hypothetical protein VHN15_11645 [Thermoanaerobaculia bacterium]|nr:hypothetical protein [Thermoanaerobaculia bacterium]
MKSETRGWGLAFGVLVGWVRGIDKRIRGRDLTLKGESAGGLRASEGRPFDFNPDSDTKTKTR